MSASRHVWILAMVLAATTAVAAEPVGSMGANTGQSILTPPDAQDLVAASPSGEAAPSTRAASQPAVNEAATGPNAGQAAAVASENRPLPGLGQQVENQKVGRPSNTVNSDVWWQTLGALVLVVGLIFGLKWFLGRYGAGRSGLRASSVVEVLSKTAVSSRQSVMLIRVGRRLLIVGAGGDGMNTLTEIDDPEEVSELLGAIERSRAASLTNSFARILRHERPDVEDDTAPGRTAAGGAADQIKNMLGRLRSMGPAGRRRL
jgi:flagellar biogenesis protein FliO